MPYRHLFFTSLSLAHSVQSKPDTVHSQWPKGRLEVFSMYKPYRPKEVKLQPHCAGKTSRGIALKSRLDVMQVLVLV